MDSKVRYRYEARARVVKALAHPSRLSMIDQLPESGRFASELKQFVNSALPTVSKHLAILRNAGFVQDEKRGVQGFNWLRMTCVTGFHARVAADCGAAVLSSVAGQQLEFLETL